MVVCMPAVVQASQTTPISVYVIHLTVQIYVNHLGFTSELFYALPVNTYGGWFIYYLIGVSLSEPHIDHDNSPHTRSGYVCMYVCMYVSLTSICRTLVLEIRVHPEMLHVLTCSRA